MITERPLVDHGFTSLDGGEYVVGIDPSLTSFGLTLMSKADPAIFATWVMKPDEKGVRRLVEIEAFVDDILGKADVDLALDLVNVAIEATVHQSFSASVLGELSGTLKRYFFKEYYRGNVQYPLLVPPTMVKKFATDRGTAKKNEMLLGIYKNFGIDFTDDNAADSYVLARIAAGFSNTVIQRNIVSALKDPKFREAP